MTVPSHLAGGGSSAASHQLIGVSGLSYPGEFADRTPHPTRSARAPFSRKGENGTEPLPGLPFLGRIDAAQHLLEMHFNRVIAQAGAKLQAVAAAN